MNYRLTSESVSVGHPDKVADQIADSILDEFLRRDLESKVACEVFCSTGLVIIGGEVSSDAYVDVQSIARETILRIGYDKAGYLFNGNSCGCFPKSTSRARHPPRTHAPKSRRPGSRRPRHDVRLRLPRNRRLYAAADLPVASDASVLADIRRDESRRMPYLRPDAKSQFTIEYDNARRPVRAHTIVLSTQHDEFADDETMHARIEQDVRDILIPQVIARLHPETAALFRNDFKLFVNPTGKFVIGGPAADTGLTGRKIIVDTYGGVPRTAAARLREGSVQSRPFRLLHGALHRQEPGGGRCRGRNDGPGCLRHRRGEARERVCGHPRYAQVRDARIARKISDLFDLRPAKIIEKFGLKNRSTGRRPRTDISEENPIRKR